MKKAVLLALSLSVLLVPSLGLAQTGKAERLYIEADQLITSAKSKKDLEKALEKLQEARTIFEKAGKIKYAGYAYYQIGKIYVLLYEYGEGIASYEKSLAISKKLGDVAQEGIALGGIGQVYLRLYQYDKAIEFFEKALAINRKVGDAKESGVNLNDIGLVYYYWDQYDRATEFYEKSLALFRKIGDARQESLALGNIGHVCTAQCQYDKAMESYEKSLAIARKIGHLALQGEILRSIGVVCWLRGQYDKALEYYEKSLETFGKLGDANQEGVTLGSIGVVCWSRGQYDKALEYYEKSLAVERKFGSSKEGPTLSNIGLVYSSRGQYDKAVEFYEKSLTISRKIGDVKSEGTTLNNIGLVYSSWGQYGKAIEYYENSLAISTKIGVPTKSVEDCIGNLYLDTGQIDRAEEFIKKAGDENSLGRLSLIKSDYPTAKDYYESALKKAEESKNANDLFLAYAGLGTVCEALEDYKKAEEYYEKGMKFTEEMRSRITPAERKNFFEVKVNGFYRSDPAKGLTRVRMKLNQAASGIDSSEMTRARAFSDGIAEKAENGVSGVPADVLKKEDQLVGTVLALKKDRDKVEKDKSPQRYDTITKEVEKAEAELSAFVDMLWEKYRPYAAVKYPRPVALKDAAIRPDEHVVIFDVVGEGVGIKLVKGNLILETFYKRWKSEDLEKTVHAFRKSFENADLTGFNADLGKELYKSLLARMLMDIPKGTPLTIIPDGVLAALPFEALVVSGEVTWQEAQGRPIPTGLTFMGDLYPINYYQSITALTLARTLKKLDPNQTDLLMGQKAQKAALFKDLTNYGNIVFATHGYFGKDIPTIQEPILTLTLVDQPANQDGFLRMSEVMAMTLNADIVALTACQTGVGTHLSGEGVMSMGRAFQYAGARSIIMSLWSVAESSSVDLMAKFFTHLKSGKSKLEALKLAREEIRKDGYDHPFYWAPFILVGEVN